MLSALLTEWIQCRRAHVSDVFQKGCLCVQLASQEPKGHPVAQVFTKGNVDFVVKRLVPGYLAVLGVPQLHARKVAVLSPKVARIEDSPSEVAGPLENPPSSRGGVKKWCALQEVASQEKWDPRDLQRLLANIFPHFFFFFCADRDLGTPVATLQG